MTRISHTPDQVGSRIQERTEAFQAASAQQQAINGKIASSVTYLTEIKKEIRALNRPMGSGVEDAQVCGGEWGC